MNLLENKEQLNNFFFITNSIIPLKINEAIINNLPDQEIIRFLDNNNSIFDLYKKASVVSKVNFLDIVNLLSKLYFDKLISFKIENPNNLRGWIKIGEIFSHGGVTEPENIITALIHQEKNEHLLIGEILLKFNCIKENNLRDALKTQKWLAILFE